jgi:hypothetical protein
MLKPGQVAVVLTDWTRSSLVVALTFHTPWTHCCVGLGDGTVLNTYPGTNAEIVAESAILSGRTYHVLDLPDADESWRMRVVETARALVGRRYWVWPCSRISAEAFIAAGVDIFRDHEPPFRTKLGMLLPSDFLSHTRMTMASTTTEARLT